MVGFVFFTAGLTGFATVNPGDSASTIAFSVLTGVGYGGVLVLVVTGVHLSTPHKFIATADCLLHLITRYRRCCLYGNRLSRLSDTSDDVPVKRCCRCCCGCRAHGGVYPKFCRRAGWR